MKKVFVCLIIMYFVFLNTINSQNETGYYNCTYVQNSFIMYKDAGGNAFMLTDYSLPAPRTIDCDAEPDLAEISNDKLGEKIPAERIKFGKETGEKFAISLKSSPEIKYNVKFQDVAYLKTQGIKKQLFVLEYQIDLLTIEKLHVITDISMRELMTINISSTENGILHLDTNSVVPFIITTKHTIPCFMAVNIQWRFAKKDMYLYTTDEIFKTIKDGASIAFTEKGLIMDGIEKIKNE